MTIVYASDNNYFPYIYISIASLAESNKYSKNLNICYLHQDVTEENLNYLRKLGEKYSLKIEIRNFEMPKLYDKLPAFASSKTTWAKFLFATMFPNEPRVLFVDPDTLILDDISPLFSIDMGDNLIGGVPECLPTYHRVASKLTDNDVYINGGMVLCNLELWRKDNFEKRALERLADTSKNLNYDQGVINELCKGRILVLEAKYNVLAEMFEFKSAQKLKRRFGFKNYYTQEEIEAAVKNPVIIHFTGFLYLKPMTKNCTHPYAKYFWKLLEESPLQITLGDKELNRKQKFRRWILHNMPFPVFLFVENVFDFRRRYLLENQKGR